MNKKVLICTARRFQSNSEEEGEGGGGEGVALSEVRNLDLAVMEHESEKSSRSSRVGKEQWRNRFSHKALYPRARLVVELV